mgnify:CR=1 FL=1|jgi:hypothetical protein
MPGFGLGIKNHGATFLLYAGHGNELHAHVIRLRTLPSAPLVSIYSTRPFLNGWPMGDHHAPGGGVVNHAGDQDV